MRAKRSTLAVFGLVALAAGSLATGAAFGLDIVLPYGNTVPGGTPGFKYTVQAVNSQIPGFEAVGFDDSDPVFWLDGVTPFGGPNPTAPGACFWLFPTATTWVNGTDIFTRFHLDFCPGVRSVRVGVAVDNDVALFVNGLPVPAASGCPAIGPDGLCMNENCAANDKVVFNVPDAFVVAGDNVFALHARDRSVVSYLDVEVSADLSDATCTPPNDPPACEGAVAEPGQLWPPNHKWNDIAIGGITDPNGDEVAVVIDSIFQDEPTDARGNGDGNTCPDGRGIGGSVAEVRAERAGGADGRVYHIGFTATDSNGATCQGTVPVCVPHDQGNGNNCIDQGALFDSTLCP